MGLFSMLMGGQQQQPYGYTYPGAGSPPNTQIAPQGGVPQLPTPPSPGANAGANAHPMMGQPPMPAGASGTPQSGSGMFQGLANNPMLMAAMAKNMGGGAAAGMAGPVGAAQTGNGQFPPMPGINAGGAGGQVPSLVDASANAAGGGGQSSFLQQLMARLQGGGGAPQ